MNNPFSQTKISTSKLDMMEYIGSLPNDIQAGLQSGSLKLVDSIIYSSKFLGGSTTKELMLSSDNQKEGVTNLNNRKLEALQYFVLSGIRLLSANVAEEAADGVQAVEDVTDINAVAGLEFGEINKHVANGELEILVSGKTAYPRNSNQVFVGNFDVMPGYYELANPRLIAPQSEIVPTLRLNESYAAKLKAEGIDDVAVRIELIGTRIIPA